VSKITSTDEQVLLSHQVTHLPQVGFYRVQSFADICGVHKNTVWNWVAAGTVRGIPVPQGIKLSRTITVFEKQAVHDFCKQLASLGDSTTPPEAA
jgi:hypothetical protein